MTMNPVRPAKQFIRWCLDNPGVYDVGNSFADRHAPELMTWLYLGMGGEIRGYVVDKNWDRDARILWIGPFGAFTSYHKRSEYVSVTEVSAATMP